MTTSIKAWGGNGTSMPWAGGWSWVERWLALGRGLAPAENREQKPDAYTLSLANGTQTGRRNASTGKPPSKMVADDGSEPLTGQKRPLAERAANRRRVGVDPWKEAAP